MTPQLKLVKRVIPGSLVFLVNKERVLTELVELARLKIVLRLKVAEAKVHAQINVDSAGKLRVEFSVDEDALGDRKLDMVRAAIDEEYRAVWVRIKERLAGLDRRWPHGQEAEEETTP